MQHFALIDEGVPIDRVLAELEAAPHLWDQHPIRTEQPDFFGTHDIWVRFKDYDDFMGDPSSPHFAMWYPAIKELPALRPIIFDMMTEVNATHLGGVLLTKIPANGVIRPHVDRGWHPEFYKMKVYVPLQTNDLCVNNCGGEQVTMKAGEAWWFNNLVPHSVVNAGDTDRITLIVCMSQE